MEQKLQKVFEDAETIENSNKEKALQLYNDIINAPRSFLTIECLFNLISGCGKLRGDEQN